ncbi:hypothetical protein C0Q70_14727 [Pomacea canaliculata]|uniref:Uncharacterized protein n=1 Tax=Pomacea canaliculata TaxID=400727 RepID=A0A2T7NSX3_POMCA|nr:hypothetical protein C0Q70_14727 [Pomacea canaliculata]
MLLELRAARLDPRLALPFNCRQDADGTSHNWKSACRQNKAVDGSQCKTCLREAHGDRKGDKREDKTDEWTLTRNDFLMRGTSKHVVVVVVVVVVGMRLVKMVGGSTSSKTLDATGLLFVRNGRILLLYPLRTYPPLLINQEMKLSRVVRPDGYRAKE